MVDTRSRSASNDSAASAKNRVAFITIGQTPRDDVLGEILPVVGDVIEVVEVGALDGLTNAEIADLAPAAAEPRLCTKLRDGSEVVIAEAWVRQRVQAIVDDLNAADLDLIVLLCTGDFDGLNSNTLLVESERVVDNTIEALAEGGRRVGVMVPLQAQIEEFQAKTTAYRPACITYASPYMDRRLAAAGDELKDMDFIAMHCMGYTDEMRREVVRASGRPALLASRLVANAVAELVRR